MTIAEAKLYASLLIEQCCITGIRTISGRFKEYDNNEVLTDLIEITSKRTQIL